MVEMLGIATELAEKRAALAERLSPTARARAFPRQYAQPLPTPNQADKLRTELKRVQGQLDEALAEANRLRSALRAAQAELEQFNTAVSRAHVLPLGRVASVSNVIRQFVAEYNALATVENRKPIDFADLLGPRRARAISWPRQVCMWLCREIAKGTSLPTVGRAFGGKDHTTVMHACKKVEERFRRRPDLNIVALRVMAHFEAEPQPEAEAA